MDNKLLSTMLQKKVEDRDSKHLAPNERAELINNFLFEALDLSDVKDIIAHPLYFDLMCFCFEMLNLYGMNSQDGDLLQLMSLVNKHMYSTYYSLPDNHIILGPDREAHTKLWIDRVESLFEPEEE